MAAPVIESFTAPADAVHGTPFAVTVTATDPSTKTVNLTATVTNAAGEATAAQAAVQVSGGALAYTLVADDPTVTITPGATPGEFTVTA